MSQIGDLEGETLAAVRAACNRCHLPLPATCLAYSLFKAAAKSDSSMNEAADCINVFKDHEAEQMQLEIRAKLKSRISRGGDEEGFRASTGRFCTLAEIHATGKSRPSRRAAPF
jgi:hypothetical protein